MLGIPWTRVTWSRPLDLSVLTHCFALSILLIVALGEYLHKLARFGPILQRLIRKVIAAGLRGLRHGFEPLKNVLNIGFVDVQAVALGPVGNQIFVWNRANILPDSHHIHTSALFMPSSVSSGFLFMPLTISAQRSSRR
jgi:hypothetical protein